MTEQPFVAPTELGVVRVTGADRQRYLEDVTSQHLVDVEAHTCLGALHLDPNGNVVATMDVVVLPDQMLLLVPAALVEHVLEVLGGRTFLLDATFQLTDLMVLSVRSDDASGGGEVDVPAALGVVDLAPGEVADRDGVLVIAREDGADLVGDAHALEVAQSRLEGAGVRLGSTRDLEDHRIRAGVPRWGHEITPGKLPEELGLLPTHVHLAKGCYPGQEAVARMWMLGKPRRRLAVITASNGVARGWQAGEGRSRVEVTSVTSDARVGLAFVPDGTQPGERFEGADGASVTVERIVGDTLDVPGHDPAVMRRRDRGRSQRAH